MSLKLLYIFFSCIFSVQLLSKVEPPNYDFSLNSFEIFMPGQSLAQIDKKYKNKELVFKTEQFMTYRFYVSHIRYKFPILVQFHKGVVTDFHARLPQYFLHDIFHQSLINRLGKQDVYKKVEEQAIYIWKNKNNLTHYYSGACTIQCFTIYYSVRGAKNGLPQDYKTLLDKLNSKN